MHPTPTRYRAGDRGIGGRHWYGSTPRSWSRYASRSVRSRPNAAAGAAHRPTCRSAGTAHRASRVAQGREAGARCDQIAGDVGGMRVARHAQAIDQQTVQSLMIRQPALFDLIAQDRTENVEAAVDVPVHRAWDGGDDRPLCRFEGVARVLIDRAVFEADPASAQCRAIPL